MKNRSFVKQVKQNTVALISLIIAISSLSYNTWRNEKSEFNRTQRHAAFEILVALNELQQVIFHHYYDKDTANKGNLRTAWSHVLTIDDFSLLLDDSLQESSQSLHETWNDNWQIIATSEKSVNHTLKAIDLVRKNIITLLRNLD